MEKSEDSAKGGSASGGKNEDIKVEEDTEEPSFEERLKKLREKTKKFQEERDEYLAGWQRAKADFINARKDEEKRREEFLKFSNQLIIADILSVLDSFDLALSHYENKGLYLIQAQLNDILKKYGLSVIKSAGEKFNPEFHEAIAEIESDRESGVIIEEAQKGYMLHEKVLRPARVKIAK